MAPTAQLEYENPYQSTATLTTLAEEATSATDELLELRAFVGPSFEYYFRKWRPRLEDPESGDVGVNWAALFVPHLWMGYRKMYGELLLYSIASGGILIGIRALFIDGLGLANVPTPALFVTWVLTQFICCLYANAWYLRHAQNELNRLKQRGYKGNELLIQSVRRGGTSALGIALAIVISGMATIVCTVVSLSLGYPV